MFCEGNGESLSNKSLLSGIQRLIYAIYQIKERRNEGQPNQDQPVWTFGSTCPTRVSIRSRGWLTVSLIILLTAPLGCLYEVAEKPYVVELDQKDESIHKPPPSAGKMLAGKKFKKAKLKGEQFMGAMLAGADLRQADLEDADLRDAMLMGANLSGANLVNANFEGAMLLGAQLEDALIDGANFKNTAFLDQDQIDEACGKPRSLPENLKAPTGINCKPIPKDPK